MVDTMPDRAYAKTNHRSYCEGKLNFLFFTKRIAPSRFAKICSPRECLRRADYRRIAAAALGPANLAVPEQLFLAWVRRRRGAGQPAA
jgi:hypothetical protein